MLTISKIDNGGSNDIEIIAQFQVDMAMESEGTKPLPDL